MNKDEAFRCRELGIEAYKAQNYEKALRLFKKSNSMFPDQESLEWIQKAAKANRQSTQTTSKSAPKSPKVNNDTKPATKKQIEEVKRIISIKSNYYQVLKVERKATTKDIEKSYKKLILTIHPDRNPHEQASEAFNILKAARDCLIDENNREIYNATGSDPSQSKIPRRTSPFSGANFGEPVFMRTRNGHFSMEGDPEMLFRFFMNNPEFMYQANRRNSHGHSHSHGFNNIPRPRQNRNKDEHTDVTMLCLQFFLMIMFAVLVMFTYGSTVNQPEFSLTKTRIFTQRKMTDNGVEYYVQGSYNKHYMSFSEKDVDLKYLDLLRQECEKEKQQQNNYELLSDKRKESLRDTQNHVKSQQCEKLFYFEKKVHS